MTFIDMAFVPDNFMLQTQHENDHHQPPTSLSSFLPPSRSQDLHGVASLLGKRSMSFSGIDNICHDQETNGGGDDQDLSDDDGSQLAGEKKIRRLNTEQVKTLEKNFELGNKLEPERKMHLARALGLQPRQIAIWFQNRRARWKTKNLEKDYEVLKRQFDAIKADNDALQAQNQKLREEILALKSREPTEPMINLNKETDQGSSSSNKSENSSEMIKLNISRTSAIDSPLSTHFTSKPLFPQSVRPTTGVSQLFQNSSRPDLQLGHQYQKIDQIVKEESFGNMFCGVDEQTGFWPWLEQQQFN